jgi:hypothetical protein
MEIMVGTRFYRIRIYRRVAPKSINPDAVEPGPYGFTCIFVISRGILMP